jgi:hypothetical protein
MVCERSVTVRIAEALCKLRRRRPDDIIRGASKVLFVSTVGDLKKLDLEFKSFININLRGDLTRLPKRVIKEGSVKQNLRLKMGSIRKSELKRLETAARFNNDRKFVESFSRFSSSSIHLEKMGLNFWAGVSGENEGEILFNLSKRQEDAKSKKDYYVKGKVAFVKAAKNYGLEARTYVKNNVSFLAKHAKNDESWCQQRAESSF